MKIIQRYILSLFIPPFFFAIAVLSFILLMNRLFLLADLLIKKGIRFTIVLEVATYSLPFVLTYITPLAVMVAGVMTYGKLAQDNELTALKASGVNLFRLLIPTLFFCIALSFVMVFFNGFLLSESEHKLRNLLLDLARKKPAVKIREGVFMNEFGDWTIYIGSLNSKEGKISDIFLFKKGGANPLFITAPNGFLKSSPDEGYFSFHLFSGEIHELVENERYRKLQFTEHIVNIPLETELIRREREYRSFSEMNFTHLLPMIKKISEEKRVLRRKIKELEREKEFDPIKMKIEEEKNRLKYKTKEGERYAGEMHKRLSLAFSCLFFFLFGSFLGIILKKGGMGFAFLATLLFFAFYYILLIAGESGIENGKLPGYLAMWLPNFLLLPIIGEFAYSALFDRSLFLSLFKKNY
ncbi:MAG: LptF/LptG family permease [candidate division WOR-3 bacterium]